MPVSSVYLGSFQDVTAAKEAAVNMISRGADFVIPDADAAGIGVIQAVREAGPNICTFGVFTDMTSTAPNNILGTYLADYADGVERIVAGIKNGSSAPNLQRRLRIEGRRCDEIHLQRQGASGLCRRTSASTSTLIKTKIISGEIHTLAMDEPRNVVESCAGKGNVLSDIPIRSSLDPAVRLLSQAGLAVLAPIAAVLFALARQRSSIAAQWIPRGRRRQRNGPWRRVGQAFDRRGASQGYAADPDRCRALRGVPMQHLEYRRRGPALCRRLGRDGVRSKFRRAAGSGFTSC